MINKIFDHSLETIMFQHDSNLYHRLTGLFQSIIDYKKQLISHYDLKDKKDLVTFCDKIYTHAREKLNKNYPKIIKEETGLLISRMVFIQLKHSDMIFMVSFNNDEELFNAIEQLASGVLDKAKLSLKDSDRIDKYASSGKFLNLISGFFDSKKAGMEIPVKIYFDIGSAFLNDIISGSDKNVLSAKEIAAIQLHEIGHVMSTLEYFTYMSYDGNYGRVMSKNLSKESLKTVLSEINSPEFQKKLKDDPSIKNSAVSLLTKICNMILSVKIIPIMYLGLITLINIAVYSLIQVVTQSSYLWLDEKRSSSDDSSEVFTARNMYMFERRANEYAVRHGASDTLVAAITKINRGIVNKQAKAFHTLNISNKIIIENRIKTTMAPYRLFDLYEDDRSSQLRILENLMIVFKDANLSPELSNEYIRQVKNIKNSTQKPIAFVDHLKLNKFEFVDVFERLLSGTSNYQYEKLLNTIDRLLNTELYYKSAEIKSIIKSL